MNLELSTRYAMTPKACIIRFHKSCDLHLLTQKHRSKQKQPPTTPLKQQISSTELKPKRDIITRLRQIAAESYTTPIEKTHKRISSNQDSILKFRTKSKLGRLKLRKEQEINKKFAETWKSDKSFLPKSIRGYKPLERLKDDFSFSRLKMERINGTRIEQIVNRGDRSHDGDLSSDEVFHTTAMRPEVVKVKVRENFIFRCKTVEQRVMKKSVDIAPWGQDYN